VFRRGEASCTRHTGKKGGRGGHSREKPIGPKSKKRGKNKDPGSFFAGVDWEKPGKKRLNRVTVGGNRKRKRGGEKGVGYLS